MRRALVLMTVVPALLSFRISIAAETSQDKLCPCSSAVPPPKLPIRHPPEIPKKPVPCPSLITHPPREEVKWICCPCQCSGQAATSASESTSKPIDGPPPQPPKQPPLIFDLSTRVVEHNGVVILRAPPGSLTGSGNQKFRVTVDNKLAHYSVDRKTSELHVGLPPQSGQQPNRVSPDRSVQVVSDDGTELASLQVREVPFDPHAMVVFLAAFITVSLFWIMMFTAGLKHQLGVKNTRFRAIQAFFFVDHRTVQAFFVDHRTMSYSMARIQFFAWTAAATFAYVYLVICKVLQQQHLSSLPELPTELVEFFALSAGTAIAATAITSTKGSEGSGEAEPVLRDLITAGGVVAVDKAQFFIWTILSISSFIIIVAFLRPLEATALPHIPSGLLALSGISAAGYLGGKLARNPGPVIVEASVRCSESESDRITIFIKGENLSPDAIVEINGQKLLSFHLDENGLKVTPQRRKRYRSDPSMVKGLEFTLAKTVPEALRTACCRKDQHRIVLTNPDQQQAVGEFEPVP